MSFDYEKLRRELDEIEAGVHVTTRYTWADLARELLRLHDGSSQLLAKKRAAVERLYSTDPVTAAVLELMCDELENLQERDAE